MEQEKKSAGESSSDAAEDVNSDGNINPSTTSATNDQDKISPSE